MKNFIIVLILLMSTAINSQTNYNFSEIKSSPDLQKLLLKIMDEHKETRSSMLLEFIEDAKVVDDIVTSSRGIYSSKIYVKGMHYAGIPIAEAIFSNNSIKLTTDTLNYSGKKLLEKIESENGLTPVYYNDRSYDWEKETETINLRVKFVNGENLALLGDKDFAVLKIDFKPIYKIPLAKIHHKIKKFKKQPDYVLSSSTEHSIYDVFINGIKIEENYTYDRLHLNKYITSNVTSVKIIAKREPDYNEKVYYSAAILDQSINEDVKIIEGRFLGDKTVVFETSFNSELPYYPEAWTNGSDLRKEKKLKEKVIALYNKLGKAILENDEQMLNSMLYQRQFEVQQVNYDTTFLTARILWGNLIERSVYVNHTVSKDFEIDFSTNGKLIYCHPKDTKEMIIFEEENYDDPFNFYLYEPKGSNELKIIR
ncbi:hypothetical protein Celal_1263 [Cellulophaga algicola DSM 14237]|uniref:Uncharacterized protein n=1 Tax=Cellulophaga algicola (strain DSM 14237 / IC166 / ACAM 630) TaxID=688270 RepID=E6X7Y0_CELAD|nr:hypothetical protein [Cellulophaga algicola]ADV48578.1 hypothetical protein Celal_1263 [Cellulophaga algicola DSM 14237]